MDTKNMTREELLALGPAYYRSRSGKTRKMQLPARFHQYHGMHQLTITEEELVAIRDGYVPGSLSTFRSNPPNSKCRVWIKPHEAKALTEYRLARGLRAPVLRGGSATEADRARQDERYQPKLGN